MKHLFSILSLLIASISLSSASPYSYSGGESQFYFSATGSASVPYDVDLEVTAPTGNANGEIDLENDFGASVALGYHFMESMRVELEYSFRQSESGTISSLATAFPAAGATDIDMHNFMFNVYYDVNMGMNYYWYIGAGIGFSIMNYDLQGVGEDSNVQFAYQVMTGLGYRITRDTSVFFGYRIVGSTGPDFDLGANVNADLDAPLLNVIEAGVRFDF